MKKMFTVTTKTIVAVGLGSALFMLFFMSYVLHIHKLQIEFVYNKFQLYCLYIFNFKSIFPIFKLNIKIKKGVNLQS